MTKIAPGGLAEQDGRLRLGDKLLSVSVIVTYVAFVGPEGVSSWLGTLPNPSLKEKKREKLPCFSVCTITTDTRPKWHMAIQVGQRGEKMAGLSVSSGHSF